MMLKICKNCKVEFEAQKKINEYCSRQCSGLSRRLTGPCTLCGTKHARIKPTGLEEWHKHLETGKIICDSCYGKIPRKGLCVECGKTESTKWSSNEKGTNCHNCAMVLYRIKIKLKVFTHYCNGKPVCCIEGCNVDDMDMLTLDHTNDDGLDHRKKIGGKSIYPTYGWARKNNYPKILQVMCWNHNIKKQMNRVKRNL